LPDVSLWSGLLWRAEAFFGLYVNACMSHIPAYAPFFYSKDVLPCGGGAAPFSPKEFHVIAGYQKNGGERMLQLCFKAASLSVSLVGQIRPV